MYSNTIYILNNTIIECFDIAFNETKKKNLFVLFDFTKAIQPHFQNWSMERKLSGVLRERFYTDNRIIVSREYQKPPQNKSTNKEVGQTS